MVPDGLNKFPRSPILQISFYEDRCDDCGSALTVYRAGASERMELRTGGAADDAGQLFVRETKKVSDAKGPSK